MGKKTNKPASEEAGQEPFHSAFTGLASLRAELPSSELAADGTGQKHEAIPEATTTSAKLVLHREKKGRAGKTATRLRGLPTPEERRRWAAQLKRELGCGATIDGDDVILLGDVGERAKMRLEAGGFRRVVLGN